MNKDKSIETNRFDEDFLLFSQFEVKKEMIWCLKKIFIWSFKNITRKWINQCSSQFFCVILRLAFQRVFISHFENESTHHLHHHHHCRCSRRYCHTDWLKKTYSVNCHQMLLLMQEYVISSSSTGSIKNEQQWTACSFHQSMCLFKSFSSVIRKAKCRRQLITSHVTYNQTVEKTDFQNF